MSKADIDLDQLSATTYSAVFADICDQLGLRNQTFEPGIRRLAGPAATLIGWARTAVSAPVNSIPQQPYAGKIEFIDSLCPGGVVALDCSNRPAAAWGELFSTAATGRGARGAIIDGLTRDIDKIDALGQFPVFARDARPTDSLGRVSIQAKNCDVTLFGTPVSPGDLIVADRDGVCVIPKLHAEKAIELAIAKAVIEDSARELLLRGGYLRDVWEKYKVL